VGTALTPGSAGYECNLVPELQFHKSLFAQHLSGSDIVEQAQTVEVGRLKPIYRRNRSTICAGCGQ
jgi:hypothetical protein